MVPTLCVGIPRKDALRPEPLERFSLHSHAERGNDERKVKCLEHFHTASLKPWFLCHEKRRRGQEWPCLQQASVAGGLRVNSFLCSVYRLADGRETQQRQQADVKFL